MNNTYTEEFRRNAVAAVRSEFSATMLSRRLNVPRTSIENWLDHPKYKDIQPLMNEELPCLVPIKDEPPVAKATSNLGGIINLAELERRTGISR